MFHLRRSLTHNVLLLIASGSFLLLTASRSQAIIDPTLQLQLGNPTGATTDPNNHDHYLIQRSVESIDYSDHLGQPNWASWDLTAADIGSSGRSDDWQVDTNLPSGPNGFYQVPTDTFGTGYDRGHMCPSADRTDTVPDNEMVFIMSNIIPQASAQNEGIWANLEDYSRNTLLTGGKELLIMCGPSLFTTQTFDSGHVKVPSYTWKIIVVCPSGSGTATNRITAANQVVAVRIPNTSAVGSDPWQNYRTNVVAIEADTGFSFFSALPHNVSMSLHYKIDGQTIPAPTVSGFSPSAAGPGSSVTISGTNLAFTTNIAFHGISAVFTINSQTNITATVPASATTGVITIAGLGGTINTSSNFNVVTSTTADLGVLTSHSGNFFQSDVGDTYTITITNIGSAASSGSITVTDTLPVGLTATAISGTGWTTDLPSLTCTRSDGVAGGGVFPLITVTVNVAANAPAIVTNIVVVSGGGDTNLLNNVASDPTIIQSESAPTVITGTATAVGASVATLNGTVNPNANPTTAQFEYGLTTNYGTTVAISGTLTGTVAQAVSTSLIGLAASTTYHFRLDATNNLGLTIGSDQTFSTAALAAPDMSVLLSHSGSFAQGDTNDQYTIVVTNVGNATSSGSVTITDAIPSGLTITAFNGSGWTFNIPARTCARSDTLAAGAAFSPITVIVSVATNAPALVTNLVSVSGGSESNLANNSANDPTTINVSSEGMIVLAGWDTSTLPGGTSNFGPSPFGPTTNAPNLSIVGLARGSGVAITGSGAARGWGGDAWLSTTSSAAITSNQFVTFSITATNGYKVSYSTISKFDYRHSSTGPTDGLLQYQVGSGAFATAATLSYPSSTSSGGSIGSIDLSAISALQNVPPGTNVTFRIVNWNGTSSAGTWYIFDVAGSAAPDFAIQGTLAPAVVPVADLAISMSHTGNFTQADVGDTYTIVVTNAGTGATVGSVNVAETLPAGLNVTAISGTGWTVDLNNPSATRSDTLAAGAAYPPLTIAVSVNTNAAANLTNSITVFGGGDVTPANNTANDPTTIVPLAPVQQWRYLYFGTTSNSGNAADGAVNSSDGIANLLKYALGLNPFVATNSPVVGDISTGFLRLTSPKNPAATDVTFYVEVTSDATANTWTTNGTTVDINTATELQVHDNTAVDSSPGRYIRLRVSRP